MLYVRAFKKSAFYLFILAAVLAVVTRIWDAQPLIAVRPSMGFIDYLESTVILILLIPVSFLLYNTYEIELGLTCGVKTSKLMLSKFLAFYIFTLFVVFMLIFSYRYTPFEIREGMSVVVPIYVPDSYKIYVLISSFVTVTFYAALFLLSRVLLRNCYAPIVIGLAVTSAFGGLNEKILKGIVDIKLSIFDVYISSYFVGNEMPNRLTKEGIKGIENVWTYNRLIFFGLAVLMFLITWFLLRREKLHEGLGE